ncbi:hypothetical protein BH23PAT1_BH23PAT1_2970 [soil metagenome]
MMSNRLNKLISYVKAKEYGKAKDSLGLFVCAVVPGLSKYACKFSGDRRTLAATLSKFYGYVAEPGAKDKLNVDIA